MSWNFPDLYGGIATSVMHPLIHDAVLLGTSLICTVGLRPFLDFHRHRHAGLPQVLGTSLISTVGLRLLVELIESWVWSGRNFPDQYGWDCDFSIAFVMASRKAISSELP